MGLSASQSRMLTLTARMSDLELKSQNIQEQKIRLAEQSTEASRKYMDALDAQTLKFNSVELGKIDATVANVTASGVYRVAKTTGEYFEFDTQTNKWMLVQLNGERKEVPQGNMNDSDWLLEQLEAAQCLIQKVKVDEDGNIVKDGNDTVWEDYSYISSSIFTTEEDETEIAKAEAEYEYTLSLIQEKDKRFDLDLENIDTEHNAIKTERDSVETVIGDNVKNSFTIFS
ncbi:hypothetical protein IJV79_01435 [bacterium]|nr:hypothetical protein [bacterium]